MRRQVSMLACVCMVLGSASSSTAAPPAVTKPGPQPARPKGLSDSLTGQPKNDYEAAKLLFTDGDFTGALIKFQSAFDASKDPRLLWNLAACEKSMRRYARAIELLKLYQTDTTGLVAEKDKADGAELVKTLEPFTVSIVVEVNEPDAEIFVDDRSIGKSPLPAPVTVDLGQRRIRVKKEGFREVDRTEPVGGSPKQTITVKLEKEVHEGKLAVQAPLGSTVTIDGNVVGQGKGNEAIETALASGGHTLRVTAPGMRVYEREVVIKDNETRAVEIALEMESEPSKPVLRVAVGCIDALPRGTSDGLSVYLDGSPTALVASGGKQSFDAERGQNVIEYVSFPVSQGDHRVLVRIPGCEPQETNVTVAPGTGADLHGALKSESAYLVRGPAGNPDWGRIAVGLWMPSGIGRFDNFRASSDGARAFDSPKFTPSATGVVVQPGLVFRWWTASLDFAYGKGSARLSEDPTNAAQETLAGLQQPNDVTWTRSGIRAGARFPFHHAALMLGLGTGYHYLAAENLPTGVHFRRPHNMYAMAWAMVDAHVFCDWPIHAGFSTDMTLVGDVDDAVSYTLQFGAAYQPNKVCRAERSTKYELESRARRGARR